VTTPGSLQVSHASGLHAVNRVLSTMHRDMLRTGGALEGGAVRLAVLNLVAACVDVASADQASQAVGRLGAKHPARAIIVLADPAGPEQIEADLSLQCAAVDSAQVCAEQVRLLVGGKPAYHLASVVTPLLVPDIPTYLWLVGAPPLRQAFGQDAIAICERLIFDSGEYEDAPATLQTLAAEVDVVGDAVALSDIAWERTRVWRQHVAQSFDGEEVRAFLRGITRVEIDCSGDRVSAQAWLFAGWLASRLRWEAAGAPPRVVARSRVVDDVAEHQLAGVTLRCQVDGHRATVTVERRQGVLHGVIDVDGGIRAERAVPVADRDAVDMVGSLLESGGEDPVYRAALRSGARLANAET
jgi:glucose-6-phosphate dehydrogenase assembly protein OpcA